MKTNTEEKNITTQYALRSKSKPPVQYIGTMPTLEAAAIYKDYQTANPDEWEIVKRTVTVSDWDVACVDMQEQDYTINDAQES